MKTRMDKYDENTSSLRSEKNKRLYDEVSDMNIDYVNIDVNNVIDLSSNKKTGAREEYKKQKELNYFMPNEKKNRDYIDNTIENKEDRVYDINEILKLAKENKLFDSDSSKKRMINTEYNILTKLDLDEVTNKEYSKENLHELIDTIYEKEKTTKKKENILYEKEDLSSSDDLLNLKEDTVNLNEDISKDILDKTVTEVVPKVEKEEESEELEEQEDKKEETDTVNEMTDTIEIDEIISKKLLFIIIFVLILLGVSAYIILKYFNIILCFFLFYLNIF